MRKYLLLSLICVSFVSAQAQELNCQVRILSDKIQGSNDKQIFQQLQQAIFEFMNTRKWTNDVFTAEEKIECNIQINLTEKLGSNNYKGSIQVSSRRPIYGSSYNSSLFNYSDNEFEIEYLQFQAMEFSETNHIANLTSVLGFYAYYIIGLDYDSYALNGGSIYFQKAKTIANNAQSAREAGWKTSDNKKQNRYWLIENQLHQQFKNIRTANYQYYRLGFDVMSSNLEEGRAAVLTSLELLRKVHQQKPNSFNLKLFFSVVKVKEIVDLFSQAFPDEKTRAINLLNQIDPANQNHYQKILKGS